MNSQHRAWEEEYKNPNFLSLDTAPQQELLRAIKWIRDERVECAGRDIMKSSPVVLDIGCGNGRNLVYMAEQYNALGYGYDCAPTAIALAKKHAKEQGVEKQVTFLVHDVAEPFPIPDTCVDLCIDMTTSHALYEGERTLYLREVVRTLKDDGIFFIRTLCLDGDRNARNLVQQFPGPEAGTYMLPDCDLMERVYTEKEFRARYEEYFTILSLNKQVGYQRWGNQSFKRRYMVAYMMKKEK